MMNFIICARGQTDGRAAAHGQHRLTEIVNFASFAALFLISVASRFPLWISKVLRNSGVPAA